MGVRPRVVGMDAPGPRRIDHAARTCPGRRLGCQYMSSNSTSVHGQNEATALKGAFDCRSTRRQFSFNVQVLQMRHPTAKLSSVRGSTIALRSTPARLASDTNSRALDWQVGDTVMRPTPIGTPTPTYLAILLRSESTPSPRSMLVHRNRPAMHRIRQK